MSDALVPSTFVLDALESRMHFSATIQGSTLLIQGTAQNDRIYVYSPDPISQAPTTINVKIFRFRAGTSQIVQASKKTLHFNAADFDHLQIETRGGDDQIDIIPFNLNMPALVVAGEGDDTLFGANGVVHAYMGGGDDVVSLGPYGNRGLFRAFGQDGDDSLSGTDHSDILDGGAGDDVLDGSDGNDTLRGGPGDDILGGDPANTGNGGNDLLQGDDGNDQCYGRLGDDTVQGGAGNDALFGGKGNDFVNGGDGEDDMAGNSGSDHMTGGPGNDDILADAPGQTLSDDSPEDQGTNSLDDGIQYLPK